MSYKLQRKDIIFKTETERIGINFERHSSSMYLFSGELLDEQTIEYEDMMLIDMGLTYYSEAFISYLKEKLKLIYSDLEYGIVKGIICCINACGMYDYKNDCYMFPETQEGIRELFDDIYFYDGPYKALQVELFENKAPILVKDLGDVSDMIKLLIFYFDLDDDVNNYQYNYGMLDVVKYVMDKKYPFYNFHSRKTLEEDLSSLNSISEFDRLQLSLE